MDDTGFIVQNEFGGVAISKDTSANGERVRIIGLTTGIEIFLDPLELERIAAAGHDAIAVFVSPDFQTGGFDDESADVDLEDDTETAR